MNKKILTIIIALIIIMIPLRQNSGPMEFADGFGFTPVTYAAASSAVISSREELINTIRSEMLDRNDTMTLRINNSIIDEYESMDKMMDEVFAYDDEATAKDGDYLKFSVSRWDMSTSWSPASNNTELTLQIYYRTTKKEEQEVDKKVAAVLKTLKLEDASDYKKVKAIHDYIIKRVDYDTLYQRGSAYSALIDQAAVCSGYTLAAYLMFTQAGLDCRIISGTGNGGDHAWNIVKVNGKWYNIDLTWDDPIMSDGSQALEYDYFLKNTKEFTGHKRDPEYQTDKFIKEYPIAKTSYQMK